MRTVSCYLSADVMRDCRAAADLMGLECADAAADVLLRERLNEIPELAEMRKAIGDAVGKIRKEWQAKHVKPT